MGIKMLVLLKSYGVKMYFFCWLFVYMPGSLGPGFALGEKEEKNRRVKWVGRGRPPGHFLFPPLWGLVPGYMPGQNDQQTESLSGQMVILAGHCLLTGHYFETWTSSVIRLFPRIMAEGSYYFFHTKKGAIIRGKVIIQGRRLFQILLTGSLTVDILFYYSIKTRKMVEYGLFKSSKFSCLINFQCQYPQH